MDPGGTFVPDSQNPMDLALVGDINLCAAQSSEPGKLDYFPC